MAWNDSLSHSERLSKSSGVNKSECEEFSFDEYFSAIIPSICVAGLSGNILALLLIQMNFSLRRLPPNSYLSALAVTSSLFLITIFLNWLERTTSLKLYNTNPVGCKIITYVAHVCDFVSIWLMLCVCWDRMVVLWKWERGMLSLRSARILVLLLFGLGGTWSLWSFCLSTLIGGECRPSDYHVYVFFHGADTVISIGIPSALICVVNTAVVLKFQSYKKFQPLRASVRFSICSETKAGGYAPGPTRSKRPQGIRGTPSIRPAELHLSRTILIVTSTFLALNLPSYILRLQMTFQTSDPRPLTRAQKYLHLSVYTLYYSHHALLFYIYIFCSRQMRRGLKPTVMRILECYCFKPVPDFGHEPPSSTKKRGSLKRRRVATRAYSV